MDENCIPCSQTAFLQLQRWDRVRCQASLASHFHPNVVSVKVCNLTLCLRLQLRFLNIFARVRQAVGTVPTPIILGKARKRLKENGIRVKRRLLVSQNVNSSQYNAFYTSNAQADSLKLISLHFKLHTLCNLSLLK